MLPYVAEEFTPDEAEVLRRYVTNLDQPVFALVNLPEVVKGALFARYSRSPKTLRRLFLDEFVGDLDVSGDAGVDATVGLERAQQLYERVFGEYGDDSVAQLGGVHLACEQASNVLTKVLERGRLMAYLEQSTRYISYDARLSSGHYRYYRDPDILESPLGARYVGDMDRMFDTYGALLPQMQNFVARRFPRDPGASDFAYRQSVRARALDSLRGLLPAGALSNVGIYGSGQAYESLLLHLRSHPLPEARRYGQLMLDELRKVIPSFLERVDRPERGGVWSDYLATNTRETRRVVRSLWPDAPTTSPPPARPAQAHPAAPVPLEQLVAAGDPGGDLRAPAERERPEVALVDWDPEGEDKVLAAIGFAVSGMAEEDLLRRVHHLGVEDRQALLRAYVGDRTNRRHRPGRAFERATYRFEVVSDYGAFRDLQRHRMLTIEWQALGTALGWQMPALVEDAGLGAEYDESMARSATLASDLATAFPEQSPYAVALGFRIRYVMQMNAREAMHVVELRSGPQGHPTYRMVAQQMHRLIEQTAGHRLIASAMQFADHSAHDLGRLEAETRTAQRRAQSNGGAR